MKAESNNAANIEQIVDTQLKGLSYYKTALNLLISIPFLLVLSLLFLFVSLMSSKQEVSLPAYLEKAKKWNEGNLAQRLSEIKLAARIMPSQNTQDNMLLMDWVSMTTTNELSDSATAQDYFYNKSLHIINDTRDYFPVLNLQPEFVPVGDSKHVCVNVAWTPLAKQRVKGSYKSIEGMPVCKNAQNSKIRWQQSDPKNGVDIQIWKQSIENIECSTDITCKLACPGVYKSGYDEKSGKCYIYEILKSICIEVGVSLDPETLEENWDYRGGCFQNDSPTLFERAYPGKTYYFDYIPIEVRADDDPFNVAAKSGTITSETGTDFSFFGWLSWVTFSLALIGAAVLGASIAASRFIK